MSIEITVLITMSEFSPTEGTAYLVVDAGGGTVDLTIHSIEGGCIKEVSIRSGEMCGSVFIDELFFKV